MSLCKFEKDHSGCCYMRRDYMVQGQKQRDHLKSNHKNLHRDTGDLDQEERSKGNEKWRMDTRVASG